MMPHIAKRHMSCEECGNDIEKGMAYGIDIEIRILCDLCMEGDTGEDDEDEDDEDFIESL